MRTALQAEVKARGAPHVESVTKRMRLPSDLVALTRGLVEPMVRGLFPRTEVDTVLAVLARSVVFLTPLNIEHVLKDVSFLSTAWTLANIYLESLGAQPLTEELMYIVGYSEETTCYVSLEYFTHEDPFADFIVHEAAHIFHNSKRESHGLPHTRMREWLLPIEFAKRETFAYACEAYSRILKLSRSPAERKVKLEELKLDRPPPDDRVEPEEYLAILEEAVTRWNGWKAILGRCRHGLSRRGSSSGG